MADELLHYPGQEEPEAPAPEAPTEEPKPEEAAAPEAPAPEAPAPEESPEEKSDEPAPESPLPKKRSIYDDLKDTRKEKNAFRDAAVAALEAQGVTLSGKETAEELQALAKKTPSASPAPEPAPSQPADELDAFAQEAGLDAKQLARLADIFAKRVPQAQLSDEEKQQLADLTAYKAKKDPEDQRTSEDNAVRAEAPKVRAQLKELGHEVHDEAEAKKVMDEIVRLSHTERYHDKEVDYIVFREREALSKLISPKKPSFESGQGAAPDAEPKEVEFSGKMTPEAAQKEMHGSAPKSQLEIRRGS